MFGKTVYQGLGTDVSPEMSIAEMRTKAGLDWDVQKQPLYKKIGDQYVEVPAFSVERDDNHEDLDIVKNRGSSDWNPFKVSDQFDFIESWKPHVKPHSVGHFKDGRIIWVMATINDRFELFDGDTIEGNLLFTNFHQYGRATDIRVTAMRWSCLNTFLYGLGEKVQNLVKIDHKTVFDPELVSETLGIAKDHLSGFKERAQFLATKRASPQEIKTFVEQVFPKQHREDQKPSEDKLSRPAQQVLEHVHDQPGAEFGEGTWWQAFNAVTYAVDHVHSTDKNRQEAAWYGAGDKRKQLALIKALEFAEAA